MIGFPMTKKHKKNIRKRDKELKLSVQANKFDNLLESMQTHSAKNAVNLLFENDADLSKTYQSGKTETN
jgi:hypothetical protein